VILVVNSGSSSLKFAFIDPRDPTARRGGLVERIGQADGPPDHAAALRRAVDTLGPGGLPRAVGHRVVHGGSEYRAATVVDDSLVAAVRRLVPLAPLHNPANLLGIEVARALWPDVPQVAVFDTAFHASLPPAAATYAIDAELSRRYGVRRYGFHGTSHRYVAGRTARLLGRPVEAVDSIVLHLGNGASATAVHGGRSVETSMGLSPVEGLVMGTRCGDLDPAVPGHLARVAGFEPADIDDLLWHRSGLAGLCGDSDMRTVLARRAAGDQAATLAFDVYCHRIRKYIGAYHAVLGRLDAIAFSAGIGEHAAEVRSAALAGLDGWGIAVDPDRNSAPDGGERVISPDGAPVAVCVVPTDEELAIALEVDELLSGGNA
jgi:acetate kinase